jgi:small subunit ribosomal protein S1
MTTKTEDLEDEVKETEEVKTETTEETNPPAGGTKKTGKKDSQMAKLLTDSPNPPETGDLVEGPVIGIEKSSVFIDLHPFGTGIIYGREFLQASDVLRKVNIGDNIAAKVTDRTTNKDGYIELSLKEARQALLWSEAEVAIANKSILEVPVKEANKGGLILEWKSIQGFLPASQLKAGHYPRVTDGDKDKILNELKKLVGTKLSVSIITADPKEGKLIFSEKDPEKKEKEKIVDKYAVGDELDGEITGIVDFGIFVKLEDGLEGLVHISEIEWGLVDDPKALFKVGDKTKVKIIEIKDGKISLSIKAMKENPWKSATDKYKKDDEVTGVVIKYNKHGALASIEEGVAGLVHVSEFENEEDLRNTLELGKTYKFKITIFEPKEQKMTLSYKKEA